MKNGIMVRTMEELRENFDAEKLVTHYLTGKLHNWLEVWNYVNELQQLQLLNSSEKQLLDSLCRIFGITNTNQVIEVEEIVKNQNLLKEVRKYTDDKEIMDQVDKIVTNQKELERLLEEGSEIIFLFGTEFNVMGEIAHVTLHGINDPIICIHTEEIIDFEEKGIILKNCRIDDKYNKLLEKRQVEKENAYRKKRQEYKPSVLFDYKLSNKDREKCRLLFDKAQGGLVNFEFDIDTGTKKMENIVRDAVIYNIFDINRYGTGLQNAVKYSGIDLIGNDFLNRNS